LLDAGHWVTRRNSAIESIAMAPADAGTVS
jgi:hypothetical protein